MGNTQQSLEKAFYYDGYNLGMNAVVENLADDAIFSSLEQMYAAIDTFLHSFTVFAQNQKQKIDCKKGCAWCCKQPVFALDYELEYLKEYFRNNFSENKRKQIKEKARQKNKQLSKLSGTDLLNAKHACPFLENEVCTAYFARPMACRIYLSSEVKTCTYFYKSPNDKNNYPALLDLPMRLGRMMNEGFKAALKTRGYIAKEYRIEEKFV